MVFMKKVVFIEKTKTTVFIKRTVLEKDENVVFMKRTNMRFS